ncbi:unnamed protein product [Rotaria socialis]|nr:unnamed protein product [Rotaria socialis]CAF4613108.1 unnamed protein product [Rotaria socialis]
MGLKIFVSSQETKWLDKCTKLLRYTITVPAESTIDYLDPRPEYIRLIIEWSTKFSIGIARTFSPDNQYSSCLLNARPCKDLDGYSQQVD